MRAQALRELDLDQWKAAVEELRRDAASRCAERAPPLCGVRLHATAAVLCRLAQQSAQLKEVRRQLRSHRLATKSVDKALAAAQTRAATAEDQLAVRARAARGKQGSDWRAHLHRHNYGTPQHNKK